MKQNIAFVLAISALVLGGAGCAGYVAQKSAAPATVDQTVDGISADFSAEQSEQARMEEDAAQVDADSSELNAFSDDTYEIK